jgi:hypothetical protein
MAPAATKGRKLIPQPFSGTLAFALDRFLAEIIVGDFSIVEIMNRQHGRPSCQSLAEKTDL